MGCVVTAPLTLKIVAPGAKPFTSVLSVALRTSADNENVYDAPCAMLIDGDPVESVATVIDAEESTLLITTLRACTDNGFANAVFDALATPDIWTI
jgi:hypothetical protein